LFLTISFFAMHPVQFLRSLLTLVVAPFLTVLFSILTLLDLMFFRKSEEKAQVFPTTWARTICRMVGVRVRVAGAENLDPEGTYIFVGNHASQFDIFSFQAFSPHGFRWIAKKELFRIPFFGPAMRRAGVISIDRSQGREAMKSLNRAAGQIAGGTSVLIFPEGTRSRDGTLQPFKTGAVALAIKAGVPVVPVGFVGTHAVLPKGRLLARSGDILIQIGKPLPTSDYKPRDKQKLAEQLHARVAELLEPGTDAE
jgi:1-acyl-sn-glycerol-3-phosphate acyltransferase